MSRVLFVTWDGGGNVPPALEIAAALRDRGDSVRFLGHDGQRASIEGRGFAFEPFTHAKPWSVLTERTGPTAPLAYAAVFTDKGMGDDVRVAIEREPVDYAVIDGLLIGALAGAARLRLPYSVLVHSLLSVTDATLNRGPLALIARLKGLNPRALYAGAERVIVATLPELDPASSTAGPRVVYPGPMVVGTPAEPERPPLVLISLSTTYIDGQLQALRAILEAIAPLPVRALLTTGPAVDAGALTAPPNVEVRQFVPHAEVMPRASLVIGHGGHATTMLALAHGVPLLVLPMASTFDQPTIGRVVAHRGAGLALAKTADAVKIRAAVERLLAERSFTDAAATLGASIRALPLPAAAAADALAGVARD